MMTSLGQSVESHSEDVVVFPIEIFRLIIDTLIPPQPTCQHAIRRALKSLYLVSTAFADICREHIYREVEVEEDDDRIHQIFEEALHTQPSLSNCVEGLVYHKVRPMAVNNPLPDFSVDAYLQLPNLRSFHVLGDTWASYEGDNIVQFGSRVPRLQLRTLMDHYLNTEQLVTLHLTRVTLVPLLRIMSSSNLRHLELHACSPVSFDIQSFDLENTLKHGFKLQVFKASGRVDPVVPALLMHCTALKELHCEPS
ncbi:hypothetical protein BJ165DRAFT_1490121 [Panaeolus papilionaceus]|nr:hypothetical protein BJ165DRAFT_1490121 [Panaeolus papilionaceus]